MYDLVSLTEAALITAIDKLANNADKLTVDEIRLLHEMYIAGTIEKLQQKFEEAAKDAQEHLAKEEANETTVSEIVTTKEEVKEEKPKAKRGRPKAKAKEEDVPVTDFEGNVLPPEKLAKGSEDKVHDEEPAFVPSKAEVKSKVVVEKTSVDKETTKPLEFNEAQLDCYVSEFKREETFESNPEAKAKLTPQRKKINAFVKEAEGNKAVLRKYFDEILDDADKGMSFKEITPFYVDNLAHYLTLREELARYNEDQIVEKMKEISGGVLHDISQLNRYNIEAILTVLKA
uniref:Uncharacterized protein n=1 Tax=Myoviridae sp. ctJ2i1 TaxID=2825079 RepID=A0A8S5V1I3_9CAUD|nr:MAG TPA: hypothetical protein [Myoviridae sp. ctJ2i1]